MSAATFELDPQLSLKWSGHETFALRYAWLPKAYRALKANPKTFVDEDNAMVTLGIGKNMVRSLKFWVAATGVAEPVDRSREMTPTDFGHGIFGEDGFDPSLEDVRTLWLLHWKISSRDEGPLFAWRYLLSHWPFPEFTQSQALRGFKAESRRRGLDHSDVTLSQHLDVFLHTYHRTRGAAVGVEDSLDGPLVDLHLLVPHGSRLGEGGRWETVYGFRREAKPEISQALFDFCLLDYWDRFLGSDAVLNFRQVAVGSASPGQVFKLPEDDIRARLEAPPPSVKTRSYTYQASAVEGLISRANAKHRTSLADVYAGSPQ
jgi:hypothetical protein